MILRWVVSLFLAIATWLSPPAPLHIVPPDCSGPCPTPPAPRAPTLPVKHRPGILATATWYDDGPGLYGAIHSWRWGAKPYPVLVCARVVSSGPAKCVRVMIRDYCACQGRSDRIDLSPAAFLALGFPLSRGVVPATLIGAR